MLGSIYKIKNVEKSCDSNRQKKYNFRSKSGGFKKKIGITTAVSNMLSLNYPYFAAYFKNKKQILYA